MCVFLSKEKKNLISFHFSRVTFLSSLIIFWILLDCQSGVDRKRNHLTFDIHDSCPFNLMIHDSLAILFRYSWFICHCFIQKTGKKNQIKLYKLHFVLMCQTHFLILLNIISLINESPKLESQEKWYRRITVTLPLAQSKCKTKTLDMCSAKSFQFSSCGICPKGKRYFRTCPFPITYVRMKGELEPLKMVRVLSFLPYSLSRVVDRPVLVL